MEEKNKTQTITKWFLFKNSVRPILLPGIVFGALVVIIFLIAILFSPESLSWEEVLSVSFGSGVFISLFLIVICSINPIVGLYQLFRQEISLKFSFVNEMQRDNIVDTNFENRKWFISTENFMIIVLNRDYIQEIKKLDKRKMRIIVTLIKFNGRKLKISSSHETISKFENWFLQKDDNSLE